MENWINKLDKPLMLPIVDRKKENDNVDTFYFDYQLKSRPGQFVMLWLPGMDEKPFSVAYDLGDKFGLAIANVGPFTDELFKKKIGDKVGIRGPYGNPFWKVPGVKTVAMVGGGYGVAALANLAEALAKENVKVFLINGARTKGRLLFQERLNDINAKVITTTDDGTAGIKGRVTEALKDVLENEKIDLVYVCGPEMMEKGVFDICEEKGINAQISVERYMKCGIGVCGSCVVDGIGQPICQKGPAMDSATIRKIKEFGKYHRCCSGKKELFA